MIRPFLAVTLLALPLAAGPALAQPQPLPFESTIPAAKDVPYPGTMKLVVDATDLDRRIMTVKQTIPVAGPGPMVLLYPEWLPGKHAARGELEKVAGLKITAGGKTLAWRRDPVEVYALHIDVPAGAKAVELELQFLSATAGDQGRIVMTREMLNLQWNSTAFYPAGWFTRQIPVEATAILPPGWGYGVALDKASSKGDVHTFKTVSFETLVDSPMFAGRPSSHGGLEIITSNCSCASSTVNAPERSSGTPTVLSMPMIWPVAMRCSSIVVRSKCCGAPTTIVSWKMCP